MAYYATSDEQSKEEKRALYTDTGIQAQDRLCGESLANVATVVPNTSWPTREQEASASFAVSIPWPFRCK